MTAQERLRSIVLSYPGGATGLSADLSVDKSSLYNLMKGKTPSLRIAYRVEVMLGIPMEDWLEKLEVNKRWGVK